MSIGALIAAPRRRRPSPVPPMPSLRPSELILGDLTGRDDEAFALWRILTDLLTWCDSSDAAGLFCSAPDGLKLPPALAGYLPALAGIWRPELGITRQELADACTAVWEWAEVSGYAEIALQYAEIAARLEPDHSGRASTSGRLCRRISERVRGTMWFWRGVRLARLCKLKGAEIDFAIAHLGWGNLESDLGNFSEANEHAKKALKAALRAGRRSLAASAYHDMMTIRIHTERFDEGPAYAVKAASSYKSDHPRLPALAHDVAFMWGKLGYYSSAAPLYEAVLPFIALSGERVVVLANLARAAGACRDRLRYERAFQKIDQMRQAGELIPASAFYHLAEGCRSFEEWERAIEYCGYALSAASTRGNALIVQQAGDLARKLENRVPGERDRVPPEGSEMDSIRELLLRKLIRHAALGGQPRAVPPEKYPIER